MAFICPQKKHRSQCPKLHKCLAPSYRLHCTEPPPDQNSGRVLREKHLGIPVPWGGTREVISRSIGSFWSVAHGVLSAEYRWTTSICRAGGKAWSWGEGCESFCCVFCRWSWRRSWPCGDRVTQGGGKGCSALNSRVYFLQGRLQGGGSRY